MFKTFKYAKSDQFSKICKTMQDTFLYFYCMYYETSLHQINFSIFICLRNMQMYEVPNLDYQFYIFYLILNNKIILLFYKQ